MSAAVVPLSFASDIGAAAMPRLQQPQSSRQLTPRSRQQTPRSAQQTPRDWALGAAAAAAEDSADSYGESSGLFVSTRPPKSRFGMRTPSKYQTSHMHMRAVGRHVRLLVRSTSSRARAISSRMVDEMQRSRRRWFK